MVNIGVDFGSTYTVVSEFCNDAPNAVELDGGHYRYPSIVAYDERRDKFYFGTAARDKLGKNSLRAFRGFKMLLNQQMSPENLRQRGYDDKFTPEYITELFLENVIMTSLKKLNAERIGTLILGAPECWFQSLDTADARSVLRGICVNISKKNSVGETPLIDDIRIISEPTNAAAFCVWNSEKSTGKAMDGNILVIDYGGGTLDTALVTVEHRGQKLNIKAERRGGKGENEDNEIGKAGIAYQEAVIRKAVSEALKISPDEIEYGADFDRAVKEFESTLLNQAADVEETFEDMITDADGMEDEELTSVEYDGEDVPVYFGQLYRVYNETIAPVLESVLDDTVEGLDISGIKIALVGGFCNFWLVKRQVQKYFRIGDIAKDSRFIGNKEQDREKAISSGAALFAEKAIELCNVACFGIGMYVINRTTNKPFDRFAINCGEEYEIGDVRFAHGEDGNIAGMFLNNLGHLSIQLKKDGKGYRMTPKEEFAKKLERININVPICVGFSIDADEKITISIYKYDLDKKRPKSEKPERTILLSTFRGSFDNILL